MHHTLRPYITIFLFLTPLFLSAATVYQAETAMLHKAVTETKNSGFLGESYINFDNEPGSYLELKVGMAVAGEQTLSIRYANGTASARPMEIKINNTVVSGSISFGTTGSWTNWETISINVFFNEGINVMRFTSVGSEGGPNIDQFEISGEQAAAYSLTISVGGKGQVIRIPESGMLFAGQEMILIAKPAINSVFKEWTGDKTGNEDTLRFILDADKSIQAHFEDIVLTIPEPDFSMKGYATVSGNGIETTTGGLGGNIVIIETLSELIAWGASREDNYTAEIAIIKGRIEAASTEVITIKRGKDISILGDSESNGGYAELKNVSLNIRDYSNVIVRNLKMHEVFYPNDDLTIDGCSHVWIDHCEFHSKIGSGIGVDTYDGLLDIKNGSHRVTVSWCYFHDHMKTVLIGHSDNNGSTDVNLQLTFHHNWFSNTDGRNPSLRFGQCHYFNNYLENISDYGFAVRNGAHAKIENCHFESVKQPIVTDNFSGHGFACISGCIYTGSCSESSNKVNPPYDCEFWTSQIPYAYTLEEANTVSLSVKAYAGVGKISTAVPVSVYNTVRNLQVDRLLFDPVNDNIHVNMAVRDKGNVVFSIFSIEGKRVFVNRQNYTPGNHDVTFPLNGIQRGIYLVRIETGAESISRKLFVY